MKSRLQRLRFFCAVFSSIIIFNGCNNILGDLDTLLEQKKVEPAKQYTVAFSNEGNLVETQTLVHGQKVVQPAALTKIGHTFGGWYKEADFKTEWNFAADTVTSNITLYAKWTTNRYTVTFDGNGGTVSSESLAADYNTSLGVSLPSASWEGQNFTCWSTTSESGGTVFDANTPVTENTTVYALWDQVTYTVTYDSDSGSDVASQIINHGGKASEPSAPTKPGYTFGGWYKDTSYATAWNFASDMVTSATTLYAKWEANTHTLNYDANGGTGTTGATSAAYPAKVSVASNSFTRTGYIFAGWNTLANGNGTGYSAGAEFAFTETGSTTLYAKWTINQYTVTFNGNGGTATQPAATVDYNTTVASLPGATWTGKTFSGWNTKADGTGTAFNTSTKVTDNITVYAVWNQITYSVTFNVVGGSSVPGQTVNYGSTISEPSTPTKLGHTFGGWYKDASYTTAWNFASDTVTSTTTIYAKWTANIHTLNYDANAAGATGTTTSTSATYPSTVNVATHNFTRSGYTFAGWNTQANGSGTNYSAGATFNFTAAGSTTLYAKWTINQYLFTFNVVEGSAIAAQNINYGSTISQPADPTRTGYTFGGWYKDASYTTAWNFASDTVTSTITIYAKWTANTHTLNYDANAAGATGSTTSTSATYPAKVSVATNNFSRTGYTFAGWNTQTNGSGTNYSAGDTFNFTATGSTRLYAKWIINQYTFTFNVGGGSEIPAQNINYGSTISEPSAPTKTGYTFGGWYKDSSYTAAWNFASDTVTSTTTIYAKWTANTYTLNYNANGGTGTTTSTSATYPAKVSVASNSFARTGYTFAGWNTQPNGSGTNYNVGALFNFTATGSTTLYAQWTVVNTITVAYFVSNPDKKLSFAQAVVEVNRGTVVDAPCNNADFVNSASNWKWYVDGALVSGQTGSTFSWSTAGKQGDYIVSVTAKNGNVLYSGSFKITVNY